MKLIFSSLLQPDLVFKVDFAVSTSLLTPEKTMGFTDVLRLVFVETNVTTTTLTFLLVLLVLLGWYSTSSFSRLDKVGIHHPPTLPFIGNLLYFREGFWENHNRLINNYGPTCGYYIGRRMYIVVSEPDMIKCILEDHFRNFGNRMNPDLVSKPFADSILMLRDERWKNVRSTLTTAFSVTKIKEMTSLINMACDILLSNLKVCAESGTAFDIQRNYGCFTLDIVASIGFGTSIDSQKNPDDIFVKNTRRFFESLDPLNPLLIFAIAFPFIMVPLLQILPNKKRDEVNEFFIGLIKNTIALRDQQDPNERCRDFIQLMLEARSPIHDNAMEKSDIVNQVKFYKALPKKQQALLSDDEIAGQSSLFLIAGYETINSTLSFGTYLLATNPQCQEKLLQEVDDFFAKHDIPNYENIHELPYLNMVVAETLRMYPPAFRFTREAAKDHLVLKQLIPAGAIIEIAVGHLHYNPKFWPDPKMFIPERFTTEGMQQRHPFAYLPFGAGPRGCIGRKLALMTIKIALLRILQKFRFQTCPETQIPLQVKSHSTLKPKDGIFIKIVSR